MYLEGSASSEDVSVQLFEAKPGDPAVPQGKAFATISAQAAGISMHPPATGGRHLASSNAQVHLLSAHLQSLWKLLLCDTMADSGSVEAGRDSHVPFTLQISRASCADYSSV